MRILQVAHYAPPWGMGGTELYTHFLCCQLASDHSVQLFCTAPAEDAPGTVLTGHHHGYAYRALRKDRCTFDRPFEDRSRLVEREFTATLERFQPDVVHFQHLMNLSLRLPALAKQRGLPVCFTVHDFWLLCPRHFLRPDLQRCDRPAPGNCLACLSDQIGYYALPSHGPHLLRPIKHSAKRLINLAKRSVFAFALSWWRPRQVASVLRSTDLFIAPSHFLLERFTEVGFGEKLVFCRHGIPAAGKDRPAKTSSPVVRLAFIGSALPHKGLTVLAEAFKRVTAPAQLTVYGSMPEPLRTHLESTGITCAGTLHEQDKSNAFSEIDILVVPSLCFENCPLTILEAFATGTPVITSAIGGMAELVQSGRGGRTVPPGDPAALATEINRCASDPELVHRLAASVPAVTDMQTHGREILELYGRILPTGDAPRTPAGGANR